MVTGPQGSVTRLQDDGIFCFEHLRQPAHPAAVAGNTIASDHIEPVTVPGASHCAVLLQGGCGQRAELMGT